MSKNDICGYEIGHRWLLRRSSLIEVDTATSNLSSDDIGLGRGHQSS